MKFAHSSLVLLCLGAVSATAQNPFGTDTPKAGNQGGQNNPFGAGNAGAGNAGAGNAGAGNAGGAQGTPFGQGGPGRQPGAKPSKKETDLIVLAIKNSNPKTPAELTRALDSMRKIGRPKLAKEFLKKLIALNMDADALVNLHDTFGSGHFKELAVDESLKPDGELLYKDISEAAASFARDDRRIDGVIRGLSSSDRSKQLLALTDLRRVGIRAVPRMINVLADGAREQEHKNVRLALVALGNLTIEPLIGALESTDTKFTIQAMHVLARLESSRSLTFLLRPMFVSKDPLLRHMATDSIKRIVGKLPSKSEAEAFLYRRVQVYLGGQTPIAPIRDRFVRLWHWDAEDKTVKPVDYTIHAAAKLAAAKAATELLPLDSENKEYRQAYMLATLASHKTLSGMDRPPASFEPEVEEFRKKFKVAELEEVLQRALRDKQLEAAMGAAEFLGHLGTSELLVSKGESQRPLVRAVQHPNPRVQFAATEAILALDPNRDFAGSSNVVRALAKFIQIGGSRRAVVGHPLAERRQFIRAAIAGAGYETDMGRNGSTVYNAAVKRPDVEFVVLSEDLNFPRTIEVYQALRKNPKTSGIPIAVISGPENMLRNREIYSQDPHTLVIYEPGSDETIARMLGKLAALPRHGSLTPAMRRTNSKRALMWVGRLAENPGKYSFYNLQRLESAAVSALQVPGTTVEASAFLGQLATPAAQRALVDLASQHGLPLALRQAAADGFRTATKKRRVLLTTDAIKAQYERYNATAKLDRETQLVMASILDSIELPTKEKTAKDP